ncbi:MAG: DNA gyrase inhibitor YacG [Polyangiales bacterium]
MSKCPTCQSATLKPPPQTPASERTWPFCSARCRGADLGAWLGASYFIPDPPAEHAFETDLQDVAPAGSAKPSW